MPRVVLCEDKAPGEPEWRSEPAGFQGALNPNESRNPSDCCDSPCTLPASPPATWGSGQMGLVDLVGDPSSPALRCSASEPALEPPVTPGGTASASPSARRQGTVFEHGPGGRPQASLLEKVRAMARGKMRTSGRIQPVGEEDDEAPFAFTRSGPLAPQKRQSFLSRLSSRGGGRRSQSSGAAALPSASSADGAEPAQRHVKFRMQVSARFVTPYSKVYGMNPRFFQYNRKGEMELTDAGIAEEMKE